jgi:hypothetical protein
MTSDTNKHDVALEVACEGAGALIGWGVGQFINGGTVGAVIGGSVAGPAGAAVGAVVGKVGATLIRNYVVSQLRPAPAPVMTSVFHRG